MLHTTIQQQDRELTWPELITHARANLDLAPIYIGTIRDEAKRLSQRPYDDNDAMAITAQILLDALGDYARGEFDADDLAAFFDDLDELVCIDDDAREPDDVGYSDYLYDMRRDEQMVREWEASHVR